MTLAQLVSDLKLSASIDASESFYKSLAVIVERAITQHNKNLTVNSLPANQAECVVILASIKVCFLRAAAFAKDANVTGANGYGQDRNTPYYKCIELAKQLQEQYKELVEDLGLTDSSGTTITVGKLLVKNDEFDTLAPILSSSEPVPDCILSSDEGDDETEVVLQWATDEFTNFKERYVFHLEGDEAIFQVWNNASATGHKGINDSAVLMQSTSDQGMSAVKITEVNPAVTNRFLVVTRTRFDNYSYSNELVLEPA